MGEMNDQIWNQRIKPVEKWLENFKPENEQDEDKILLINLNLRRGTRTPSIRGRILKQWKTEFSNEIHNATVVAA